MATDSFCYHVKSALAHLQGAINELNAALDTPSYKLLSHGSKVTLGMLRNNLWPQPAKLQLLLSAALDDTSVH